MQRQLAIASLTTVLWVHGCTHRDVGTSERPTTNVFVDRFDATAPERVDVLVVVDNSPGMADKQELLAEAASYLLARLTDPICVISGSRVPTSDSSSADGCDEGEPQFPAVTDIHLGVVTTSLGGHDSAACSGEGGSDLAQSDGARLVVRSRDGGDVETWNDVGFLSWDPDQTARNPEDEEPGLADREAVTDRFRDLVVGAGQQGCEYEAALEAWYRFLIDPEPPLEIRVDPETQLGEPVGIDEDLLAQRAQFLRPDSMVAIVMLTDENDCSIRDDEFGHLVGNPTEGTMPCSTTMCDLNPNDPCCMSCIQATYPAECGDPRNDPKCQAEIVLPREEDRLSLRCFNQKQRFGLDLLYPISRYIDGLVNYQVPMRDGGRAPNPLYAAPTHPLADAYSDLVPRLDASRVFLAGIVGVPWQDLGTDDSLIDDSQLEYLTARSLSEEGIWEQIVGVPGANPPVPPSDPFMVEQIDPRQGTNPRTGLATTAPDGDGDDNPINGREYAILNNNDLQYACIFPLADPRDCSETDGGPDCPCAADSETSGRPLCDASTQTHAGAYPASRILQVLQGYGANAVVASICPKFNSPEPLALGVADPSYGYNPAMGALVDRLAQSLGSGGCLPREISTDEAGGVLCRLFEAVRIDDPSYCTSPGSGRQPAEREFVNAIHFRLEDLGICGPSSDPCSAYSVCELVQAEGADRESCQHDADGEVTAAGYCFIDASTDRNGDGVLECETLGDPDCLGDPRLVAGCPERSRRRLRLASPPNSETPYPRPDAYLFIGCGAPAFRAD